MRPDPSPPATGVRLHWDQVPAPVRAEVEDLLGSPVVSAVTQVLGFSPGVAARVVTRAGGRAFVKAVPPGPNPDSPRFQRREIGILQALPPGIPVPRMIGSIDHGPDSWVVILLEEIDGAPPELPWSPAQLGLSMSALATVHEALTPAPGGIGPAAEMLAAPQFQRWAGASGAEMDRMDPWTRDHLDRLVELEAKAPAASAGSTLLHLDVRADNILLDSRRAWIVDWPHARVGARWVDVVFFAASVEMQGGPTGEELLAMLPAGERGEPEAVDAVLASFAGMFSIGGLKPPSPGLPTVRPFQFAQGIPARRWLAARLG